nr:hypothetical protein HK105_005001 [Polyrhizophydium stewartii]
MVTASVFTPASTLVIILLTSIVAAFYGLGYLGVLWDPQSHLPNVKVGFVNADAGFNFSAYPPAFAQAVLQQTGGRTIGQVVEATLLAPSSAAAGLFNWQNLTGVPHDDLVNRVNNNELWNVVYIPANFSDVFLLNFNFGKPQTQLVFMNIENIYDQARQMSVVSIINAVLTAIVQTFSNAFAQKLLTSINTNPVDNITISAPNIRLIANNLHPIPNFGHNFATYVICIVLWLSGLVTATLLSVIYMIRLPFLKQHGIATHLRTPTRIILSAQTVSLLLSFLHALVAWGVYCGFVGSPTSGFNPDYNSFVVLMYTWFIAATFHSVALCLCVLLGKDNYSLIFSLLLILQLATSSAILDPDVMVGFAKVTYGLPLYYANRSLKCMILGTSCSFMPFNTGIMAIWFVGMSAITFVVGRRNVFRTRTAVNKAETA